MKKSACLIVTIVLLSSINSAIAVGVWDKGMTILGLNSNSDYQGGNQVSIKLTTTSVSGCQIISFKPGFGNIPNDSNGTATIARIYSTALAAFLSNKDVSIWVWDTTNCYGLMLIIGDTDPF